MALKDLLPPSDLLSRIDGIESGLRQVRRIGRAGQFAFLLVTALGVVVESGVLPDAPPGSRLAALTAVIRIGTRLLLPLLLLVLVWSKFWIRQAHHPFRYTCSVKTFAAAEHSPVVPELAWLSQDLKELLSQRIERLRFYEPGETGEAGEAVEGHIAVGGVYVIRAQGRDDSSLAVEVMPEVSIGTVKSPRMLSHPITYPPDPMASPLSIVAPAREGEPRRVTLSRIEYHAILERVYFSVATEIYRQIRDDVERKVALMPTAYLAGQTLYHEAEDYARSNTLNAYDQAQQLYEQAAQRFDPSLRPLPTAAPRHELARAVRTASAAARWLRRRAAVVFPALARRDIACARAQTGFASMLTSRRQLAGLSGLRSDPIFAARSVASAAVARLEALPADVPGRLRSRFEAEVTLALALLLLGAVAEAEERLRRACALDPARAERDPSYLFVRAELEPHPRAKLQIFRRAVEARPRFELAHWELAYETEQLWRSRPALERTVADMVAREYQAVLDINLGNMAAWANRGYMRWLLGEDEDLRLAHADFEAGRDYKAITRETMVAELDYGLARIAAERGDIERAYRHYVQATSALIGHGGMFADLLSDYYFRLVGPVIVERFERYKRAVEQHLVSAAAAGSISPRVLNSVYAFVLNDYGDCCHRYYVRSADERYRERAQEAYELAAVFNGNYVMPHYNLVRLANSRGDVDGAEAHAARIHELEPTWPQGILVQVQAHAARAARERRRADELQKEADGVGRDLAQLEQRRAALSGHAPPPRERTSQGVPPAAPTAGARPAEVDVRREVGQLEPRGAALAEQIAKLSEKKSEVAGQATAATEAALTRERDIRLRTRQLVPHELLWASSAEPGDFDLNWTALEDDDLLREAQLDDQHVEALISYGESVMQKPGERALAGRLLTRIQAVYWPRHFTLLRLLRECAFDQAMSKAYGAAMRTTIERGHIADPANYMELRWYTDTWTHQDVRLTLFEATDRLNVFTTAAARGDLSGALHAWLADQLILLGEAPRAKAFDALLAACQSAPPAVLWDVAVQAARLGRFDITAAAYERAMALDRERSGARMDAPELRGRADLVRCASSLAEYIERFPRFLEAARRPEAPFHTAAEYTAMRAATRMLDEKFDEGVAELQSVVDVTPSDDAEWQASLVDSLARLLDAARHAGVAPTVVDQTYYALKDWLSATASRSAAASTAWRDASGAGLSLSRHGHPDLKGRQSVAVTQARAGNFYQMVTPLALEVAGGLASRLGLREGGIALTTDLPRMSERIVQDSGVRIPPIRVRANDADMSPNQYLVMINEIPLEMSGVEPGNVFVLHAQAEGRRADAHAASIGRCCAVRAPSGAWTEPEGVSGGSGHLTPVDYIVGHVERLVRRRLAQFLSLDEGAHLLEQWSATALTRQQAAFVTRLRTDPRALTAAVRVLRALIDEGVPLVAAGPALDGLRAAADDADPVSAVERARRPMRPWLPGNGPTWRHLRLGPDVEKILMNALSYTGRLSGLTLSPEDLSEIQSAIRTAVAVEDDPAVAVVVGPSQLRPYLFYLLEAEWPTVPVLTREELASSLQGRYPDFPVISLE